MYNTIKNIRAFDVIREVHIKKQRLVSISMRDYNRQNYFIRKKLCEELNWVFNCRDDYELWHYVNKTEKKLKKDSMSKYVLTSASGTAAIQIVLHALDIKKGDEVILPVNTHIASALAISNVGAKPVFVDIQPKTYNIDPDKIEEKISKKTKAIMPVHLFGQMAEMAKMVKLAKKFKIKIIEDACQAYGAAYRNKKAGTIGDVGCFSFQSSKNLGGFGSGGMITTQNRDLYLKIKKIRDSLEYNIKIKITNRQLDAVQAAVINAKLPYTEKWINKKREIAEHYTLNMVERGIIPPLEPDYGKHTYYSYVIRVKKRDKLKRYLKKHGITTIVEYPLPLHLTETYNYLSYKRGDFPESERACNEVLSLPIHPFLTQNEVNKIVKKIKSFKK